MKKLIKAILLLVEKADEFKTEIVEAVKEIKDVYLLIKELVEELKVLKAQK